MPLRLRTEDGSAQNGHCIMFGYTRVISVVKMLPAN